MLNLGYIHIPSIGLQKLSFYKTKICIVQPEINNHENHCLWDNGSH